MSATTSSVRPSLSWLAHYVQLCIYLHLCPVLCSRTLFFIVAQEISVKFICIREKPPNRIYIFTKVKAPLEFTLVGPLILIHSPSQSRCISQHVATLNPLLFMTFNLSPGVVPHFGGHYCPECTLNRAVDHQHHIASSYYYFPNFCTYPLLSLFIDPHRAQQSKCLFK